MTQHLCFVLRNGRGEIIVWLWGSRATNSATAGEVVAVKGAISPWRSQGERNSPNGIFLFGNFFFLCL